MDWIKKRYDQFVLVLAAVALLAVSVLLAMRVNKFGDNFADAKRPVAEGDKIPELELGVLKETEKLVEQPVAWQTPKGVNPYMFVPDLYVIGKSGLPEKPGAGSFYTDSLTGKPIPNSFFTKYG